MKRTTVTEPYFPHLTGQMFQFKLTKLRVALGWEGYGLYCALLERLRAEEGCELPYDAPAIALMLGTREETIQTIVEDFQLFTIDREKGIFFSPSLDKSLLFFDPSIAQRHGLDVGGYVVEDEQDDPTALTRTRKRINKEIKKGSKTKKEEMLSSSSLSIIAQEGEEKSSAEIPAEAPAASEIETPAAEAPAASESPAVAKKAAVKAAPKAKATAPVRPKTVRLNPPTVEEVAAYAAELHYEGFDAAAFVGYYGSVGWKVGNKDMVNWRQAVVNWHSRAKRQEAERQQLQAQRDAERRAREEARDAEFRRQSEEKHRAWMMKNADANERSRLFHEQRDREIAQMVQEAIYAPPTNYDDLPF